MKRFRVLTFSFFLFLVACGNESIETNLSEKIDEFTFTTQDDEPLSLGDLKGKWWIANFMYTECTQVCPRTTANMLTIQSQANEADLDLQIVSFSVDPDFDTPNVLKEHVQEHQVDLTNWSFLTGYEFEVIKDLSQNSFQTVLEEGSPGEVQFAHSTSFFLINPKGELIKKYDGMGSEEMDVIMKDLEEVL